MKKSALFLGIALLVGICAGFSPAQSQTEKKQPTAAAPSFEGFRMEDSIINVAGTAGKAVVSISSEHVTRMQGNRGKRFYYRFPSGESPFGDDDHFRRFFDDFFGEMPDREFKQIGLGSGVIVDPEGYILTNQHVVDDADKITVTLPDGREFKGEVKGQDSRSDLAIVKVNARDLPVAALGDSDNLKIGQWVVAIGNPFGFALQNPEPTVTAGVIGALHRSLGRTLSADRDYGDLIQTDAAINPGNSGGPLVNLKGEVVGINVAIFSTSGGYQGVGFAIPINSAKRIISSLIRGKKIVYGWLGVTVQDLTDDLAKYFGLPDKSGVLVSKVLENSPAQKAGMKESDVIKQFDNKAINNVRELLSTVGQTEAGRKVQIKVIRDKKELAVNAEIGERPQDISLGLEEGETAQSGTWRGLNVSELNPDIARRLRIEEKRGVAIVDIQSGSPADETGLMPGDVITEINKVPVSNLAGYNKATKDVKGDALVRTSRGYFLIKPGD